MHIHLQSSFRHVHSCSISVFHGTYIHVRCSQSWKQKCSAILKQSCRQTISITYRMVIHCHCDPHLCLLHVSNNQRQPKVRTQILFYKFLPCRTQWNFCLKFLCKLLIDERLDVFADLIQHLIIQRVHERYRCSQNLRSVSPLHEGLIIPLDRKLLYNLACYLVVHCIDLSCS